MANDFSINATYAGRPLGVLAELIRQRQRFLGEDSKDAVAAMAINVMQSLRANTRVASEKGKNLRVKRNSGYVAGWRSGGGAGGHKRWIVARPAGEGTPSRRAILSPSVERGAVEQAQVFDYYIDRKGPVSLSLIIAQDEADAMEHAPAVQRILKHAGLARRVWGVLMSEVSGRTATTEEQTGSNVETVAGRASAAEWQETANELTVKIHDKLNYAADALRGGAEYVDVAMMKAANKVAGQLQQWAKSHWIAPWEADVSGTPFPEIVRRGRK